jgi:hypothetical protein
MAIITANINILETSTVTLSAGSENASFPLTRTYDRDIGKLFKGSAAATTTIHLDQGASGNLAIDQLFIPVGHNLNGETLDIEWSDNDSAWTPAVTQWVQGDALLIDKSWTAITHRYWRFTITSPSNAPEIPELFLTIKYSWERDPQRPSGAFENVFNVENLVTSGGQDRFIQYGNARRQRNYSLRILETQKDNFVTLWGNFAGRYPFWLKDVAGTWIYGKLTDEPDLIETAYQLYEFQFNFLEVLG